MSTRSGGETCIGNWGGVGFCLLENPRSVLESHTRFRSPRRTVGTKVLQVEFFERTEKNPKRSIEIESDRSSLPILGELHQA